MVRKVQKNLKHLDCVDIQLFACRYFIQILIPVIETQLGSISKNENNILLPAKQFKSERLQVDYKDHENQKSWAHDFDLVSRRKFVIKKDNSAKTAEHLL